MSQNNLSLKSIIRKFCYLRLNYTRCTDIGNREHEPKEASCHESGNGGKLASAQKQNPQKPRLNLSVVSYPLSVIRYPLSVIRCQLSVVREQGTGNREQGSNCGFLRFSGVRELTRGNLTRGNLAIALKKIRKIGVSDVAEIDAAEVIYG